MYQPHGRHSIESRCSGMGLLEPIIVHQEIFRDEACAVTCLLLQGVFHVALSYTYCVAYPSRRAFCCTMI